MHFEMCTHRVHKMLKPDKKNWLYRYAHVLRPQTSAYVCINVSMYRELSIIKDGIHCPCQQNNGASR